MISLAGFAGRAARRLVRLGVVLLVLAVTAGLALVALLPHLDAHAMVVTSGSMEPTIPVGGLVIVDEVDGADIEVDDVITFEGYTGESLTTHRVMDRRVVDDRLHFRTKGDANDTADVDLAPAEGVVGRVHTVVPYAGRALSELQRPVVRLALLGVPSLALFTHHVGRVARVLRQRRGPRRPGRRRAVGALLVVAAFLALSLPRASQASAARLTDMVTIGENAFHTGTW